MFSNIFSSSCAKKVLSSRVTDQKKFYCQKVVIRKKQLPQTTRGSEKSYFCKKEAASKKWLLSS